MKKKVLALLLSGMLVFSACGSDGAPDSPADQSQENGKKVELTIPADFMEGSTQANLDEVAKKYGFESITLNTDGSATYIMTQKQHEDFMKDYREQINSSLKELVGSETYPNFTKIEANDNFTEFTITTKSESLDMNETFSVILFYMYGGMYNIFSGETVDNVSVTFVNEATGKVISSSNSKDS